MTKAIRIARFGGPEAMTWDDVEIGKPGPGEALIRHTAIGLNFIDVYHRTGLYPIALPAILGQEGAGIVVETGPDVHDIKAGDRVAYCTGPLGAYSEMRLIPAERLVVLPPEIPDQTAAAMMLQGLTAHYLIRRTFPVKAGDTILIHAAAGGVGLILCQWAKHLGATIIGTVSTEDKAALAKAHGCDHPILYTKEDFVARTRDLTNGQGVAVVYDSVGKDTFLKSLDCLKPLGMMVLFGQSSGKVEPFDPGLLAAKGSLFLTRPTLHTYAAERADLVKGAGELIEMIKQGIVTISINQRYALKDAATAHRDLEARKTTGSTVLIP